MQILIVYDNTVPKSELITDIIGNKGFGDVVIKKNKLEDTYKENIMKIFPDAVWKIINSPFEYPELSKNITNYDNNIKIFHCYSNFIFSDNKKAFLSLEKLFFIDDVYCVKSDNNIFGLMFNNLEDYISFLLKPASAQQEYIKNIKNIFEIEGVIDISSINNFIKCISGNADARFFNSIKLDEYTVTKQSKNIEKIKSEYNYYHLLPDSMKMWFVMPFDYKEDNDIASYKMERLYMTDLAIKWVHGSISIPEFIQLCDKYFYYINKRSSKACSKEEYNNIANSLYVDKVNDRIKTLKTLSEYKLIERILPFNIDELVDKYFKFKNIIENKNMYPLISVIGHGDCCFSNTLYNNATKTLKFIDPKGALTKDDLWTNPYYDVAKLSHSICGRYDFFNNALFDISLDSDLLYKLEIPFDNTKYTAIFRDKLSEYGFDYLTVRIYESSLFLSMLPLHIDYPQKVMGFILNAKNILDEIEREL